MIICKKRIINDDQFQSLNLNEVRIGIQVTNNEHEKLGIKTFDDGLRVEPSPELGINSTRNARGYFYPDKKLPKVYKTVNTIEWTWKTWGGDERTEYRDVSREVYQRKVIESANIELELVGNTNGEKFIIAEINESQKKYLKQTINMILEVFGYCEIFDKDLDLISDKAKIKRCNWELLPPGVLAKIVEKKREISSTKKRKDFNQHRLDTLQTYGPLEIYVGSGGFTGYYAYIFESTCFLENAIYGNATYVIPKDDWKELSQLSKNDLLATNKVVGKINHDSKWFDKLETSMKKNENK